MSEQKRNNLSRTESISISLGSGIVAGFAAAVLSQPADTLLSQINKGHGPKGSMASRLVGLSKELGFRGLFAGLGPRMVRGRREAVAGQVHSMRMFSSHAVHDRVPRIWAIRYLRGCQTR